MSILYGKYSDTYQWSQSLEFRCDCR